MSCGDMKHYLGLLVETLALMFMASGLITFKTLHGVPAEYFSLYGAGLQFCATIPFVICLSTKTDFTVKHYEEKHIHLLRGLTGLGSFLCKVKSLQMIPASDVVAINKTIPVFVTLLAYVILKEKFGVPRLVVLAFTVCGVVLVCRPSFLFGAHGTVDTSNRLLGSIFALSGCILASFTYICQRLLKKTPISVSVLSNSFIGTGGSLLVVCVSSSWSKLSCTDFPLMFCANIGVCIAVVLKFVSSRMEDASRLAVMTVVDLPFTILVEAVVFGIEHVWITYLGTTIIAMSIISLFILKTYDTRRRCLKSTRENVDEVDSTVKDISNRETSV